VICYSFAPLDNQPAGDASCQGRRERKRATQREGSDMRKDARRWLCACFLVLAWIILPPRLEAG
jgi:hypothetical protein